MLYFIQHFKKTAENSRKMLYCMQHSGTRPSARELPADHKAWEIEAFYIAQSITQAILLLSPQKVILGGGVMQQPQLYPLIREAVRRNLNGYVSSGAILDRIGVHYGPGSRPAGGIMRCSGTGPCCNGFIYF